METLFIIFAVYFFAWIISMAITGAVKYKGVSTYLTRIFCPIPFITIHKQDKKVYIGWFKWYITFEGTVKKK